MDQTADMFLGKEPVGRLMKKYAVRGSLSEFSVPPARAAITLISQSGRSGYTSA